MKQLKFMLAAAAAFGIATAQADTQLVKTEISSENFDGVTTLNDTAAVLALDGFSYEGATASDNESVVVAGGANQSDNALKVNTGTDPLLRKIDTDSNNAVTLDSTGAKKVYIDTMVQFTVTPASDTVTKSGSDKLMIYLKEMTNDVGVVTGTNLMVKAAKYTPADYVFVLTDSFDETDVSVSAVGLTVTTNTWYSLEVVASVDNGVPVFSISVDGKQLTSDVLLYGNDGTKFPSLMGKQTDSEGKLVATLDKVGFAGEGKVDELVFSHDVEQETSVDFTFAWSADRISAVKYAIGDAAEYTTLGDDKTIADLDPEATIKIQIVPAEWYEVKEDADLEYTASEESAELDDLVVAVTTKVDPDTGDVVVNPGESVPVAAIQEAAGITEGAFFAEGTTKADLEKALTWKNKNNTSGKADINKITFSGVEPTSSEAEAYLLNCDPEELDDAKAAFKFPAFTPGQLPQAAENDFNGRVILKGAAALGAWFDVVNDPAAENYGKILVDDKVVVPTFFKAVLVK